MIRSVISTVCATGLLLVILGASPVHAQKLHAIILTDVSPWAEWGLYEPNLTMDSANMFSMFSRNVPQQQLELHFLTIEEDADGDPRQIMDFIESISVEPNDTFALYFSGHGGNDDRGQFLAFAGGRLYRDQLLELMKRKRARLSVLITDCCNQRSDGERFVAPGVDARSPPSITPLFRSLFFEPSGIVDVNGSSPGEGAFFSPLDDPSGDQPGSLFTKQIARFAERYRLRRTTWDHLMRSVSLNVHLAFRNAYPGGAVGGKGGSFQSDQNVYAYSYPGMSIKEGPRTGLPYVTIEIKGRSSFGFVPASRRVKFMTFQLGDISHYAQVKSS